MKRKILLAAFTVTVWLALTATAWAVYAPKKY